MNVELFRKTVRAYYLKNKRILPWRDIDNPYFILVSEIMLQQTQVPRVIDKYSEFTVRFPTIESLAKGSTAEVLLAWQGLGYNRRALFLRETAQKIKQDFEGKVPRQTEQLILLPGIGFNTACAIMSFAFNIPTVFIETNIRTVFIHHFFRKKEKVSDKEIIEVVKKTLDHKNPRDWYYALMDYGSMLKRTQKNPSRKSKGYVKQSKFEGSKRQIRGEVIRQLLERGESALEGIESDILAGLVNEGLIKKKKEMYTIGD